VGEEEKDLGVTIRRKRTIVIVAKKRRHGGSSCQQKKVVEEKRPPIEKVAALPSGSAGYSIMTTMITRRYSGS
jgi:hypothetical protein